LDNFESKFNAKVIIEVTKENQNEEEEKVDNCFAPQKIDYCNEYALSITECEILKENLKIESELSKNCQSCMAKEEVNQLL
jgi:hypothetical protein